MLDTLKREQHEAQERLKQFYEDKEQLADKSGKLRQGIAENRGKYSRGLIFMNLVDCYVQDSL